MLDQKYSFQNFKHFIRTRSTRN